MSHSFRAYVAPQTKVYEELASVRTSCPFSTAAYADAWRRAGRRTCVLAVELQGRIIEGCLAVMHGRWPRRRLEIVSAPRLSQPELFWNGVRAFCRSRGISRLDVESFGSVSASLPTLRGQIARRTRVEHVLDLACSEPFRAISSNHLRNAARARKAGCVLVRVTGVENIASHAELIRSSIQRRRERGEAVTEEDASQFVRAILDSGAGELYQARRGEIPLSSLLLLRSAAGAYYHSAGTSADGMRIGASAFLVIELAHRLRSSGTAIFNLGGAGDHEPGLRRFKTGFGTREVALESASFKISRAWMGKLLAAGRATVASEHYLVFSGRPEEVRASAERLPAQSHTFRKLLDCEIAALMQESDWRVQGERFQRLGWNGAYGLFVGGELVHVSWLIDAEHDAVHAVRNVKLRPGEAEITHCLTRPAHRGRGYYRTAIRALCQVATELGIERVFMITAAENAASQAGIAKAGLRSCGDIRRYVLWPWASRPLTLTFRGHRGAYRQ